MNPESPDQIFLPVPAGSTLLHPASAAAQLLAAFLSGRSPETIRAYRQDLEDFRAFIGAGDMGAAAARLLGRGHGEANALALAYRARLLERGLAPSTINRRLAALRSMIQLGNFLGLVPWKLEVEGVKAEAYRDTRGPGKGGFRKLLGVLARQSGPKAIRDRAALRLLFDLALRRAEVIRLDLADVDIERGSVAVLGKGRSQKVAMTLPTPTRDALAAWLAIRGQEPGPLFRSFDQAHKGDGRLTGNSLYRIVRDVGRRAGLKTWPHGLRHAAITEALDATGGDVRAVQRFSRHKDVRVIERYDDNRTDMAGEVARRVAGSVEDGEGDDSRAAC